MGRSSLQKPVSECIRKEESVPQNTSLSNHCRQVCGWMSAKDNDQNLKKWSICRASEDIPKKFINYVMNKFHMELRDGSVTILAALPEDLSLTPSIHMVVHNHL